MTTRMPGLGVAMIGYAFMGRAHSNAWRNVGAFYPEAPEVRQQVIVGRDSDAVAAAGRQLGWAESATDWREVLERDDIDIVDICTPGHLHEEVAVAALAAGKHVLVEKPLANDAVGAEAMVAAARKARAAGVRAMVGFNYRRVPALALARELVASGEIGTVRQARLSYLQDWLVDENAPMTWRLRRETAGSGAIGDLASHAVDQLQWLIGDLVESVSGTTETFVRSRVGESGAREEVTVDDAAWATLHTSSGTVASLEVSRMATGRKNALQIELYGTRGSIAFDLERLNELAVARESGFAERVLVTESSHPYLSAWWPPGHILGWDHTFVSQAADFLRAVAAGEDPRPSFEDGLAVQRVLDAVGESATRGSERVRVEVDSDSVKETA